MKQLIESAIEVFSERGFEKTTTREVAQRAGCAEGLIHFYFGGKRELLHAALESERLRSREDEEAALAETLDAEIAAILGRIQRNAWKMRGFYRVCMSLAPVDPEIARITRGIEDQNFGALKARLDRLQERSPTPNGLDTEALAHIVGAMGFHASFFWRIVYEDDEADISRRMDSIARQLGSLGVSK